MASRLNLRMLVALALAVVVCAVTARRAHATLTIDLRAVNTTSGTIVDEKHVLFTGGMAFGSESLFRETMKQ